MSQSERSRLTRSMAARTAALLRVRWFVRAPIALYRARLGFVFGSRLLMLEHTGRNTGARRHVVLEVVSRPRPGNYVVVSGFGDRAQWFRNVRANPDVRIWISGGRPRPATARLLGADEAAAALAAYVDAHPRAWAALKPVFEATLATAIDDRHTSLPMIALAITGPGTRPIRVGRNIGRRAAD
jgi:deazaflavin-dependent oxidoreductase (nitroreductase family)